MRYTIDQHIGNLLFYQECVVIPEFGAFLTRYFPAEINPGTHMFRPPSKRVVFNVKIQDNDGLLAKHISQVENTSYEQALQSIAISVRAWKKILSAGKKVNLHGIGRLFIDDHNNLQFNPGHDVNYHAASYGLHFFRANAMEREQKIRRSVNRAIDNSMKPQARREKPSPGNPLPQATRNNWVRYVAVLGPVAALILVGSYLYTQQPQTYQNISGYVSELFTSNKKAASEDKAPQVKEENSFILGSDSLGENPKGEGEEEKDLFLDESLGSVASQSDELAAETDEPWSENAAPLASTEKASKGPYGVVVGSFSEQNNAQSYAQDLKAKGYEARTLSGNGMTRVLVGAFSSSEEARNYLPKVKSEIQAQAWLYLP